MARTMDSPKLRKLPRPQIQAIAKREFVRAIGKTEDIIRRLLKKHPKGVPIPDSASASPHVTPSASAPLSAVSHRYLQKNQAKTAVVVENAPAAASASAQPKKTNPHRGTSNSNANGPATVTSVHSDDVQLLYPEDEPTTGPSCPVPIPVPEKRCTRKVPTAAAAIALAIAIPSVGEPDGVPPLLPADVPVQAVPANAPMKRKNLPPPVAAPSEQPSTSLALNEDDDDDDDEDEPAADRPYPLTHQEEDLQDEIDNRTVFSDDPRVEAGPDENMVIDVLRQFTLLIADTPKLKERFAETNHLIKRSDKVLDKLVTDARELTMVREHLEESLLARMKDRKELVDGTNTLHNKQARKLRMEWIRQERKELNEKKWRAANRANEARGLSPLPWELFDEVESDTPTSLQTTPASSRSGSPKRTREESDADDSDVASDDDARRKRSRS